MIFLVYKCLLFTLISLKMKEKYEKILIDMFEWDI